MRRAWQRTLAVLLIGLAAGGCSGFSKKSKGGLGAQDAPKTYEQYAKENQQRSIHSPTIGMEGSTEPSKVQQAQATVSSWPATKAVTNAFKSGSEKTKAFFTPPPKGQNVDPKDPTAIDKKPKLQGADYQHSVAQMHEDSGNLAAAAAAYDKALQLDPKHFKSLIGRGRLLDRENKLAEACASYERAATLHPTQPAGHNHLGLCYARRGMLNEAAVALNKAVALKPGEVLYRNNLATVHVELGQNEEAYNQLRVVHGDAKGHYNLAALLHKRGDTRTAAYHYDQAARRDTRLSDAREWAARLNPPAVPAAAPSGSAPSPDYVYDSQPPAPQPPQAMSLPPVATPATSRRVPAANPEPRPTFSANGPALGAPSGAAESLPAPASQGPVFVPADRGEGSELQLLPPVN